MCVWPSWDNGVLLVWAVIWRRKAGAETERWRVCGREWKQQWDTERVQLADRSGQSNQQKANEWLWWIETGPADGCSHMVVHRRCPTMLHQIHLPHSSVLFMCLHANLIHMTVKLRAQRQKQKRKKWQMKLKKMVFYVTVNLCVIKHTHQCSWDPVVAGKFNLCLTSWFVNAELSGLNVNLDPNGSHQVARSLTGYITDQSSAPRVSAWCQEVQHTHTHSHQKTTVDQFLEIGTV